VIQARAPLAGHRGFTLFELMISVAIFVILVALGYGSLKNSILFRETTERNQAKLHDLQTAVRLLSQDFEQLAPRPIRDPLGGPEQPALVADKRNAYTVLLTRDGWSNTAGLQRPALQRVGYILDAGTLRRDAWTVLDATQANEPVKRELLKKVKRFELRYLDGARQWQTQWPPTGTAPAAAQRLRPLAVEVTLETEDWGVITRLFEVPG
jgi:general secretion pathway protein J